MTTYIYLTGAQPLETKEIASLLGGLDGQYVTLKAIASRMEERASREPYTIEAVRAYIKHTIEGIENFVPGGTVFVDELYIPTGTYDDLVESANRTALWGRESRLIIPMTLAGLEALNILGRNGLPLAVGPITSVDQVAAVAAMLEEATINLVTLMVPFSAMEAGLTDASSAVAAMHAYCQNDLRLALCVVVEDNASLKTALSLGVAAIAAPYAVLSSWIAEGKPGYVPVPETAPVDMLVAPEPIDNRQTFSISNRMTDAWLSASAEELQKLLS